MSEENLYTAASLQNLKIIRMFPFTEQRTKMMLITLTHFSSTVLFHRWKFSRSFTFAFPTLYFTVLFMFVFSENFYDGVLPIVQQWRWNQVGFAVSWTLGWKFGYVQDTVKGRGESIIIRNYRYQFLDNENRWVCLWHSFSLRVKIRGWSGLGLNI